MSPRNGIDYVNNIVIIMLAQGDKGKDYWTPKYENMIYIFYIIIIKHAPCPWVPIHSYITFSSGDDFACALKATCFNPLPKVTLKIIYVLTMTFDF